MRLTPSESRLTRISQARRESRSLTTTNDRPDGPKGSIATGTSRNAASQSWRWCAVLLPTSLVALTTQSSPDLPANAPDTVRRREGAVPAQRVEPLPLVIESRDKPVVFLRS